jgi:hypothetical protein
VEMPVASVRKDVRLRGKSGDMAIVRVRKIRLMGKIGKWL